MTTKPWISVPSLLLNSIARVVAELVRGEPGVVVMRDLAAVGGEELRGMRVIAGEEDGVTREPVS